MLTNDEPGAMSRRPSTEDHFSTSARSLGEPAARPAGSGGGSAGDVLARSAMRSIFPLGSSGIASSRTRLLGDM